jgi:hypothetical protein
MHLHFAKYAFILVKRVIKLAFTALVVRRIVLEI